MTIDELLVREEIRQLIATYNTSVDSGRREEFSSVFCEDAILQAPGLDCSGREDIVNQIFTNVGRDIADASQLVFQFVRHQITTSQITLTSPNIAKGRTYFLVVTNIGLDHSGIYTDEFRKEGESWKISRRKVTLDYMSADSLFQGQRSSTKQ